MSVTIRDDAAAAIKAALIERGWSQALLAYRLGVSEKHVSQVLLGRAGSWALLDRMAELLELELTVRSKEAGRE